MPSGARTTKATSTTPTMKRFHSEEMFSWAYCWAELSSTAPITGPSQLVVPPIIGMAIGAFITVSWALATDIVPGAEAARYLGIANIATCIGSGVARLLGGVLIDPINKALGSSSSGYQLLFALATLCFLVSSLVIIPLPKKGA